MVQNQVRMGALKDGQTGFVKVSGDGTSITKKDTATVTTVTIGNEEKALQIGTLAIVLDQESYEVNLHVFLHQYGLSTHGPADGRTDGRTDGWTDGPTDGHTLL